MIADATTRLAEWWGPFLAFVAGAVSSTSVISFTHLMHVHPYHPGTTSLTGKPWSRACPLVS